MRDIAMEQAIIAWLDKRNKVSKARRKQIQSLCSEPVIIKQAFVKISQEKQSEKQDNR